MKSATISVFANSLAIAISLIVGQIFLEFYDRGSQTETFVVSLVGTFAAAFLAYYIAYRLFGLVPMGKPL